MFKVVAQYLVDQETTSNYYNRDNADMAIATSYSEVQSQESLTIFDDTVDDQSLKLIEPALKLSDNSAGSFEFTLPECNVAYGHIGRMISEIIVYQDEEEIWRGRVLSEEMDFQNRKKYYCEGELAYLNDTMIPPGDYQDYDVGRLVREILNSHNKQIRDELGNSKYPGIDKYFEVGVIEIHNNKNNEEFLKDGNFTTNYETTLEVINNIAQKFKGHIQVRHRNGVRVIDFLQDLKYQVSAGQTIDFGVNLLDFTRTFDMSDVCTAVLALGKLPSDFKPKADEIGSHSGAFQSYASFLPNQALSKWVDGFAVYNVGDFYVSKSFQVTGGKKYAVSSRLPNGMVAISYIDKNNNFLSNVKHDGSQWVGKEFSVPSDCVAMSVASYGAPPSVWLVPGQNDDINVPTGSNYDTAASNPSIANQMYNGAGIDPSGSNLPPIDDIMGSQQPGNYVTYRNSYSYGSSSSPTQVPIENRERYVTYTTEPTFSGPAEVLSSSIIEDRDIITYGLAINTIRINVQRSKVDEEVKYIYSARMDYPFMVYAILDDGGNIIDGKTVSEIVDKDSKHNDFIDEVITVPPRGVTLYVSSQVIGNNGNVFDFHVWEYNKLYDKVNMYLTVEEVNNGNPYVINQTAIATYGWIAKSIEFEVEDKQTLLSKAQQYLQEVQFDRLQIDVKAVDLAYISPDVRSFKLYETVRCVSVPHGLDARYPVTAIDLPLDKPDQVSYTLGDNEEPDYTEANTDTELDLVDLIKHIPSRESVLVEAKRNATEIMNRYCHGYVTIVEDDPRFGSCIYISDSEDYEHANHQWLWSLNGLGYSNDGGKTFGLAITMDGSIVADYITAGTMNADRIRSGLLIDLEGKNYWNLETGDIALGLNLKTTKIQNANDYYGNENGDAYPTSNNDIELGAWIYDRTSHDHEFRSMFGSGTNLVDGMQGFSGPATDENGQPVMEDWYNPKTGLMEKRQKQNYWLYISASMISTGVLKGKNGRLWFDLNSGSLWVAGASRLELDPDGNVLYPDGNGGWTREPSSIEKHIRFEEGALFGYSNAQWNSTITTQEVASDYANKNDSMADVGHKQGSKYHIFTAANLTGGTCEGFLDLVSTYGKDAQNNNQYDVLLAGSNRVHINFGNSLLIGQSNNLFDVTPKILVTATGNNFAIGDVEKPEERTNLEVYGDAQIGHKLEEVATGDRGAIGASGTAPDRSVADKYKGDLVVNGSATFGRNYYTEEVTQTNSTATSSAITRRSGDYDVATGTNQTPGATTQVTKKVYYDDVTFYANVSIEGEGVTSMDHLNVGYNMAVGTKFGTDLYSMWDHSWKFMNENESYSTEKTYEDSELDEPTEPDNFNAINGDLLINGKVQFVGGTIGLPDGRLVIGARESGTSGAYTVPQGYTRLDPSNKLLMKNYYNLIYAPSVSDTIGYNIYESRLVVEGNSLLFGDVNVLKGCLTTESFSISELIPNYVYSEGDSVQYNRDNAIKYHNIYKRFVVYKPFIFSSENDASYKYFDNWPTSYVINNGVYLQEGFPLKINSGIYYEGDNRGDGLVISATNANNTLNHSERLTNTYRITLKAQDGIYVEDGPLYLATSFSYTGTSSEGLVFDVNSETNRKNTNQRPDASKRITFKSDTYFKGCNLYLQSSSGTKNATLFSTGRIDAKILDLTSTADSSKDSNNPDFSTRNGELSANYIKVFGMYGGGPKAYINSDGSSHVLNIYIGSYTNGEYLNHAYIGSTGASHFSSVGVGGLVSSGSYYNYINLIGSSGTIECRTLKINVWDNDNSSIGRTWTALHGYASTTDGVTSYKLKLNASEGVFTDYVQVGYTTIKDVQKYIGTSTYSTATMLSISRGIAPLLVDVTGYTNYSGSTSGYIYANTYYAVNSSYEKVAKMDSGGNVGGNVFQRRVTDGWVTVISSSGKGFFNGVSSDGNVSITGSLSATSTISASGSIDSNGGIIGKTLSTKVSNNDLGTVRIDENGNATLGTVSCGNVSCGTITCGNVTASSGTCTFASGVFTALTLDNVSIYQPISYTTPYLSIDGYYGFNAYELRTSGALRIDGSGNFYQSSDISLKKDIKEFDKSALGIIESVPVKSFTWKDSNKKVLAGFIAQDMECIDKTYGGNDYQGLVNSSEETKTIAVNGLVPLLWKAVQELSQEVKELKEALRNGRNQ